MLARAAFCAGLVFIATAGRCGAHDLGVQGRTYPIGEIDMRLLEAQSASKVNVKKIDAQLTKSAKRLPMHLAQYVLPAARETRTRWVDPSEVLSRDIEGMRHTANGHWVWGVFWRKGTVVNPLKYVRPTTALLYVNAHSPQQIALAKAAVNQWPSRVVVVETQGDPIQLARQIGMPVYMAQHHSLQRYQVRKVPSIVVPGPLHTVHAFDLRVTAIGLPYVSGKALVGRILAQTWPASGVNMKMIKAAEKAYGGGK